MITVEERARAAGDAVREAADVVGAEAVFERITAGRQRRAWLVPVLAAGGLAALIALVAVTLPLLRTRGPVVGPDPTTSAPPAPPADAGWQRIDDASVFGGDGEQWLRAGAVLGQGAAARVVFVGETEVDAVGPSPEPAAWVQTDGEWQVVRLPVSSGLGARDVGPHILSPHAWDVVAFQDGLIAVGSDNGRGTAWRSPDGINWTQVLFDEAPDATVNVEVFAIALGGPGLIAVGIEEKEQATQGLAWLSADGDSWQRVPVPDSADLWDVAAAGDRVVAVAHIEPGAYASFDSSDGGRTWSAASPTPGVVTGITAWRDNIVAFGRTDRGSDADGFVLFHVHTVPLDVTGGSDDPWGRIWETEAFAGVGHQSIGDLDALPDGRAYAVGEESWDDTEQRSRAVVWAYDPAAGWSRIDDETFVDERNLAMSAVVVTDTRLTASGSAMTEVGTFEVDGAVWTGPLTVPAPRPSEAPPSGAPPRPVPAEPFPCTEGKGPQPPPPGVPPAVAAAYDELWATLTTCDPGVLVDLALRGDTSIAFNFGRNGIPTRDELIAEWATDETFVKLAALLSLPPATLNTQLGPGVFEDIYVWPAAAGDGATEQDWKDVEASGLHTSEELARMREMGEYTGWRVGATSDGAWFYFISGD